METNRIIEELNAIASLGVSGRQKRYFEQCARDARPVQCVPMRDVFNEMQMAFYGKLRMVKKQCYRNASNMVELGPIQAFGPLPGFKYVEGLTYEPGFIPIEHAFVKIGDKYIDPTFERALHINVTKCEYVSLVELEWPELAAIQAKTGYYGEIYNFLWSKKCESDL